MTSPKDVADAIQSAPSIGKLTSKIYDDLVSPAATQVGKTAGALAEAILTGPRELFMTVTQAQRWLGAFVRARLDERGINPDRVIAPDPQIYLGAVSGMIGSGQVAELREMFGNLLAHSMDSLTSDLTHPSFPEIIRQLSPFDARLISHLRLRGYEPVAWLRGQIQQADVEFIAGGPFAVVKGEKDSIRHTPHAFQNLARLGLIVLHTRRLRSRGEYSGIERSRVIRSRLKHEPAGVGRMYLTYGVAEITDFGTRFGSVVIENAGSCPPPAMMDDSVPD